MKTKPKMKAKLVKALKEIYDEREATNIADYYVDAMRGQDVKDIDNHLKQLSEGQPVQYVTNTSFFYDYKLYVNEHTLIPRPETEELVHWVVADNKHSKFSILDIGTGSGCIILSILKKCNGATGTGIDVDNNVKEVFDINASRLDVVADFITLDFLDKTTWEGLPKYNIIASNPPYIAKEEVERLGTNVLAHEPHLALFTNGDPLIFYRRTLEFAVDHMDEGGKVYFETSDLYDKEMRALAEEFDLKYEYRKDMQGAWRMLKLWRND